MLSTLCQILSILIFPFLTALDSAVEPKDFRQPLRTGMGCVNRVQIDKGNNAFGATAVTAGALF